MFQLRAAPETASPTNPGATKFRALASGRDRGAIVVRTTGVLDGDGAPVLAKALMRAMRRAPFVIVDLRELTRVDSAGVGVIAAATREARLARCQLVLVRGPSRVDRLLAMSGGADPVEIVDLMPGEPAIGVLAHVAPTSRGRRR